MQGGGPKAPRNLGSGAKSGDPHDVHGDRRCLRDGCLGSHRGRSRRLGDPLRHIGDLLLEQGQVDESLGYQQRALAILESALGSSHQDLGLPLTSLGRAQLELGRTRAAVATLARAVELLEDHVDDPAHLAHGKFHLARALWLDGDKRHHVTTLAHDARETFADLGERSRRDLEAVERWLTARGGSP